MIPALCFVSGSECARLCVSYINLRRTHSVVATGSGIAPRFVGFVVLLEAECDTWSVSFSWADVKLLQRITVWFQQRVKSFSFIHSRE